MDAIFHTLNSLTRKVRLTSQFWFWFRFVIRFDDGKRRLLRAFTWLRFLITQESCYWGMTGNHSSKNDLFLYLPWYYKLIHTQIRFSCHSFLREFPSFRYTPYFIISHAKLNKILFNVEQIKWNMAHDSCSEASNTHILLCRLFCRRRRHRISGIWNRERLRWCVLNGKDNKFWMRKSEKSWVSPFFCRGWW